ncbi:MAG TPA: laccase domain-containing protein, partial [Pedococcus sp.]|nr:laccase domain-containing protein [Pedococcus sp.]
HDVAVQWIPGCSREDDRLYSYRRDGTTGRFAGVVVLAS